MFLSEAGATFLFISVILMVKFHNDKNCPGILGCLAVGGTLFGMINMIGQISGAAINPAVGFVQTMAINMMYGTEMNHAQRRINTESMWIYVAGPFTGGLLAALFSMFNARQLEPKEPEREMVDEKQEYRADI